MSVLFYNEKNVMHVGWQDKERKATIKWINNITIKMLFGKIKKGIFGVVPNHNNK